MKGLIDQKAEKETTQQITKLRLVCIINKRQRKLSKSPLAAVKVVLHAITENLEIHHWLQLMLSQRWVSPTGTQRRKIKVGSHQREEVRARGTETKSASVTLNSSLQDHNK